MRGLALATTIRKNVTNVLNMSLHNHSFSCQCARPHPRAQYNISWEDPRPDHALLKFNEEDSILMIASGGDNCIDFLLANPRLIVACDLNPHQLALVDLKLAALARLSHDDCFSLFGESDRNTFDRVYESSLRPNLQLDASRVFWDTHAHSFGTGEEDRSLPAQEGHSWLFSGSSGMYAKSILWILHQLDIKTELQRLLAAGSVQAVRDWYQSAHTQAKIGKMAYLISKSSFLYLACAGVPKEQVESYTDEVTKMTQFDYEAFTKKLLDHLFMETDLCNDNYFYYGYLMGKYSRTNCPRYLTADGHAKLQRILLERPECVALRQGLLHMVAGSYRPDTFTKIILLGALLGCRVRMTVRLLVG